MFGHLGVQELAMICAVALFWILAIAYPATRICRRLGFPPQLGLLAIVPLVNVGLLLWLAFAEWPAVPSDGARRSD